MQEIILGQGHSSAVDWWTLGVLIYEMVYGRTPFRGKNRQTTFTNILEKDLLFPANIPVSLEGRQLMRVLLEKDPAKRLGSLHGANDIKTHPFFYGINWPLIRNMVGSILFSPPSCLHHWPFFFPSSYPCYFRSVSQVVFKWHSWYTILYQTRLHHAGYFCL
jgi:serine/threonine protein kinase